jgi:hypothetical protein
MPRISAFYGIAVYMYFRDHVPPHFHAIYGEHEAQVEIATGAVMNGALPRRALGLIREWARRHQNDLDADWSLARAGRPLNPIPPLD